jgi:hypothetical protein
MPGLRYKRRHEPPPLAPSVTISRLRPKPQVGEEFREKILANLASGALASSALAVSCGADVENRSWGRARNKLLLEGRILRTARGRQRVYSLAPAEAAA